MTSLPGVSSRPFQTGARRTTRLKVPSGRWLPVSSMPFEPAVGGQHLPLRTADLPRRVPSFWAVDPTTNSAGGLPNRPDEKPTGPKPAPRLLRSERESFWDVLNEITGSFSGPRDWSENLDSHLYPASE